MHAGVSVTANGESDVRATYVRFFSVNVTPRPSERI